MVRCSSGCSCTRVVWLFVCSWVGLRVWLFGFVGVFVRVCASVWLCVWAGGLTVWLFACLFVCVWLVA